MIIVDDGDEEFALDFDALFLALFLPPPLQLSLDFLFSGIFPGRQDDVQDVIAGDSVCRAIKM